jgi:hypothetical protein
MKIVTKNIEIKDTTSTDKRIKVIVVIQAVTIILTVIALLK